MTNNLFREFSVIHNSVLSENISTKSKMENNFITEFSVIHNSGSADNVFTNQCMLISIYDHLRYFTNINFDNFTVFRQQNNISPEVWGINSEFNITNITQKNILNNLCNKYQLNIYIRYLNTKNNVRYLGNKQTIFGINYNNNYTDIEIVAYGRHFELLINETQQCLLKNKVLPEDHTCDTLIQKLQKNNKNSKQELEYINSIYEKIKQNNKKILSIKNESEYALLLLLTKENHELEELYNYYNEQYLLLQTNTVDLDNLYYLSTLYKEYYENKKLISIEKSHIESINESNKKGCPEIKLINSIQLANINYSLKYRIEDNLSIEKIISQILSNIDNTGIEIITNSILTDLEKLENIEKTLNRMIENIKKKN
jgi:hypothetical protein